MSQILRVVIYYTIGHMLVALSLIVVQSAYAGNRTLYYIQLAIFMSIAILCIFFSAVLVVYGLQILRLLKGGVAGKSDRKSKTERNITLLMICSVLGFFLLCISDFLNFVPDHTIASVSKPPSLPPPSFQPFAI